VNKAEWHGHQPDGDPFRRAIARKRRLLVERQQRWLEARMAELESQLNWLSPKKARRA